MDPAQETDALFFQKLDETDLRRKEKREFDEMLQMIVIFTMAVLMIMAFPKKASAHCDTMDGPTAIDGMKALEQRISTMR